MPFIMAETNASAGSQHVNSTTTEGEWQLNDIRRLRRFLCIGTEGTTYYIHDKVLSRASVESISRLIDSGHGSQVIDEIKNISVNERSARPNPCIFALAVCARSTDLKTKQGAYEVLPEVCKSPAQLFQFVDYTESLSDKTTGWGRSQRKAISKWYNEKEPMTLALAVTKYKQRNGWSHIDLLRLAHVKPSSKVTAAIFKYVIKGFKDVKKDPDAAEAGDDMKAVMQFLEAVDIVKHSTDAQQTARLVEQHKLVVEHLPTGLLNSAEVWRALLQHMPLTDVIRNLGKMSSLGILDVSSPQSETVICRLRDEKSMLASGLHPFNVLLGMKTYEQGKGEKGKLKWIPNPNIIEALNTAFYSSFRNVEPTKKRFLLAVDVSASMSYGNVNGSPQITPVLAASAMAMAIARSEQCYHLVAFSQTLTPLKLNPQMQLNDVFKVISEVPIGGTDCAQPMLWAMENNKEFDVFMVFTDSETWAGKIHPAEALKKYRQSAGIPDARLVVCALTSSGFTLADPDDPGMFDLAGFDSAAPLVIRNFIMDQL